MHARPIVLALWLLAGGAFLVAAPPSRADPKKAGDKAETKKPGGDLLKEPKELSKAAQALADLERRFQKEGQALSMAFGKAKSDAEKDRIRDRFFDGIAGHVVSLARFAKEYANDPTARKAQAEMRQGLQMLRMASSPGITKAMRSALEVVTDKGLKGQVALVLGNGLRNQSETAYQKKDRAKSVALAKESEGVFEQVVKEFGPSGLGEQARDALYELRHLSIGKKAPEIEAEDLDAKKFKLSDYRGKVVVLDFWGNW